MNLKKIKKAGISKLVQVQWFAKEEEVVVDMIEIQVLVDFQKHNQINLRFNLIMD